MTEAEFVAAVFGNPINRAILSRLPELECADCWLVSGALFQTVWNILTKRAPEYGIKDYDIFYFGADTSWASENDVIKRAAGLFDDLNCRIEIRNQARVHLWYEDKFGLPYLPLLRSCDGIDRFLMRNAQVGICPRETSFEVYAPRGFGDIENMIIRPNPSLNFSADRYLEKALRWKATWPELEVLAA